MNGPQHWRRGTLGHMQTCCYRLVSAVGGNCSANNVRAILGMCRDTLDNNNSLSRSNIPSI